ncbi:ubiquinone biosynthesis protein COQ9, mitochondrial-like isoform X2 [Toxorhynchites rutilus septentrionalis]|uniref:ubiquinone biosynthesis protein COQ9, mitochondrial-like isoform X2 n=1 Tax=Toxorhynchites rutilus septentrionalis TaxID=329112 RepID=UPI0024794C91|nr:ubiquinone biosynthesis protein COQ9, mitochondrial-like isoform X2 [Toxorhynchites rutilus septentrionalis]
MRMFAVRGTFFCLKTINPYDPIPRLYHVAAIVSRLPQQKCRIALELKQNKSLCTEKLQTPKNFDIFRADEERKEQNYTKHTDQTYTDKTNQSKECNNDNDSDVSSVKNSILNAAISFVPTHGWSIQSIAKGAESLNYTSISSGLFPRGGIELVLHFYRQCNDKLVDYMKQEVSAMGEVQRPSEFARKAIELRLRMLTPYIGHWSQALGLMALPPNAPTSLANLLTLVDDICYYSGDRSVDFNWYIKRIGLAGIYKTTELYMLQDKSVDNEKTWKYLEQRMQDATAVHKFLVMSEDATAHVQSTINSVFLTARNILGLNFDRR